MNLRPDYYVSYAVLYRWLDIKTLDMVSTGMPSLMPINREHKT